MEYLFNNFTLDPDKFELRFRGNLVAIEPQVFLLLKLLIENPHRVVSKDEVIENIWKRRFVSDASVAGRIKSARFAVGDGGVSQHTIRTIYGQGFRFIADISEQPAGTRSSPKAAENTTPVKRWHLVVGLAVAVLIATVFSILQPSWQIREKPTILANMAFPLPDRPSVAVLPFINLSKDESQGYFADGMTNDLITDLSKLSGLFVIARNSTFAYKNKNVKVRQVAEELGVRYVLEGSVRRVGDLVRINVQLVDALSGRYLWAERYDSPITDVFKLQNKVIIKIVAAMSVALTTPEPGRLDISETVIPAAYDAYLQGREHFNANDPENTARAIGFFKSAVALDPGYHSAHAALASAYWKVFNNAWAVRVKLTSTDAVELTKKHLTVALERPGSVARRTSAAMLLFFGKHKAALDEIDRAILSDPNDPENFITRSNILIYSGSAVEAEKYVRMAMRLNPKFPAHYLNILGKALFNQDRYEDAAEILERAVNREPDYEYHYTYLIPTYGYLNQSEKARLAIETFQSLRTDSEGGELTVQPSADWTPYASLAGKERFQTGSRKAGLPEGAAPSTTKNDIDKLITISAQGYSVEGIRTIGPGEARQLRENGVLFIDVCSKSSGNPLEQIPGSVRLDYKTELTQANLAKYAGKDTVVVFYCDGKYCFRSPYASAKSYTWGYRNVLYFAGGIFAWKDAGYPIENMSIE